MTELLAALGLGMVLGALYFAGLWLSVAALIGGGRTWMFALGALFRLGLVVAGAAWFLHAGVGPAALAAAVVGFALARQIAARTARAARRR